MILFDDHIFQMGWFNHQLENLVNKSVFVKSLICKKIWGFVFNPYSWRSLYDYVVVEYGIFFSGNQICYQTCCMLGVGCNWQFGRCFGISRPWALSQISCKEKGYSKCRGPLKWKSNVSLKSEKKTANKKCHSFPSVILVKLPQRRVFLFSNLRAPNSRQEPIPARVFVHTVKKDAVLSVTQSDLQ